METHVTAITCRGLVHLRRKRTRKRRFEKNHSPRSLKRYVQVQTRQCDDDDDPGEIAEGWFSVDGGVVTVTDVQGREIGSRAMLGGRGCTCRGEAAIARKESSRRARILIAR